MPTGMRDQILDAAQRVITQKGLGGATTREIARAARCAEGTLYVHFQDKEELFLCVLRERLPEFVRTLTELRERAGRGTVRANLEEVARAALAFFHELLPMTSSIFAQPELAARHREAMRERNVGPHRGYEAIADYLRAEQELGRVVAGIDPYAASVALVGACYHYNFVGYGVGEDMLGLDAERLAKELVRVLCDGLVPEDSEPKEKRS